MVVTDSTALMAAARIIGHTCSTENASFLNCKVNDENPKACLLPGNKVTTCVLKVLRKLENECTDSYMTYKNALDDRWHEIDQCRKEQLAMENCWRGLTTTVTLDKALTIAKTPTETMSIVETPAAVVVCKVPTVFKVVTQYTKTSTSGQ